MAENGNKDGFAKSKGWIKTSNGDTKELRADGKLWYLDIWVEIQRKLADSHFVRQS